MPSPRPPESAPARAASERGGTATLLTLLLVVVAGYANSLTVPFLFDDPRPGTPLDYKSRPLVWASFALNRVLSGESTWSYHVLNGLLHLLCGGLLYTLVWRTLALAAPDRRRSSSHGLALVSALLWLAHPLQTESVTYLSQRAETMGALFLLGTLVAFVRSATDARPRRWQLVALLSLALGFFAKETVATAPLLVWLYDGTFLERGPLAALRRRPGFYSALAVTALAFFVLCIVPELVATDSTAGLHLREHGPLEYARTQPGVILHYLRLALWPHPLVFDYGWPIARELGDILLPTLVLTGLGLATVALLVRRSWVGFAGAWFFVLLAPTSSVVPIKDLAFEHRLYLPLAALVLLVVVGGRALCLRLLPGAPILPRVLALALLLALTGATVRRNRDYRSSAALWSTVVERAPENPRGYSNLATALKAEGREDEALALLRRVVELDPTYPSGHFKLGNSYLTRGEFEAAIPCFERALALSDEAETRAGLGIALFRLERYAQAEPHFRRAIEREPDDPDHLHGLANTLAQLGRPDEAIPLYRQVLALDPTHLEARTNLASLLSARGRPEEALEHIRSVLALAPSAQGHHQLGQCLEALGRSDEALRAYRDANRLAPLVPEPCAAIARLLAGRARATPEERAEALRLAGRANELTDGKRADVLEALAMARAADADPAGAVAALEQALALPGPGRNPELARRLQARLEEYRRALRQ